MLNEKLGKVNFWVMLLGFNLTFGPHAHPRPPGHAPPHLHLRAGYGFDVWNMVATIGAFILAFSVLLFIFNIFYSRVQGPQARCRPGRQRPLGRPQHRVDRPLAGARVQLRPGPRRHPSSTTSGTASTPRTSDGRLVRVRTHRGRGRSKGDATNVHLPSPSYWPHRGGLRAAIIAYGLIYSLWLCRGRRVILFVGVYGWALEPSDDRGPHEQPRSWSWRPVRACPRRTVGGFRCLTPRSHRKRQFVDERPPRAVPRAHVDPTPTPASPTPSWACGCSWLPSACCSGRSSPPTCCTRRRALEGPDPADRSTTSRSRRSARSCCS